MLTGNDVRNAAFSRSARGYKISEVDDFLDQVIDTVEKLQKENEELMHKIEVLADRIQQYRDEEDSIRSALLTAQKSADKILKEADVQKQQVLNDARQQADDAVRLSEEKSVIIANETRERVALVLNEAKEKASRMLNDAKEKSDQMLVEATQSCRAEKEYLEFMKEQENIFRQRLVEMYKAQFEMLKKGPEMIKDLDRAMAQKEEPASLSVQEEPAVVSDVPVVEEPAKTESTPEFLEPEDIPLPVAQPVKENETKEEETVIDNGFELKRKFTDLKFGDDYDISSDDNYDDYEV
jgi:cell division initiation protein